MSEEKSNREKILIYLNKSGSSRFKRIIDLNELSKFAGVPLAKVGHLCQNLRESKKIYFKRLGEDKAVMRSNWPKG